MTEVRAPLLESVIKEAREGRTEIYIGYREREGKRDRERERIRERRKSLLTHRGEKQAKLGHKCCFINRMT